jgi:hypothetical protein
MKLMVYVLIYTGTTYRIRVASSSQLSCAGTLGLVVLNHSTYVRKPQMLRLLSHNLLRLISMRK